jgi:hypothetical protein
VGHADNVTETLLHVALHIAGVEPRLDLDDQGRPDWLFGRTVQESCDRAGFADQGSSPNRHLIRAVVSSSSGVSSARTPETERAIRHGALSQLPKWGLW